jgi:S-adenosylmethionine/arginine decarboxylase-like enzyme
MIRGPIYTWGGEKKDLHAHPENPKIDGISCVQFLHSSSITLHAIDELNKVFINVFSCEKFDAEMVKQFALDNVGGVLVTYHNYRRK